jgi:hypothetical protein
MALMAATPNTVILGARNDELPVSFGLQSTFDRRKKTRPAGTALILCARIEQWQVTRRADVVAGPGFIIQRATVRTLSRLVEQDCIAVPRK